MLEHKIKVSRYEELRSEVEAVRTKTFQFQEHRDRHIRHQISQPSQWWLQEKTTQRVEKSEPERAPELLDPEKITWTSDPEQVLDLSLTQESTGSSEPVNKPGTSDSLNTRPDLRSPWTSPRNFWPWTIPGFSDPWKAPDHAPLISSASSDPDFSISTKTELFIWTLTLNKSLNFPISKLVASIGPLQSQCARILQFMYIKLVFKLLCVLERKLHETSIMLKKKKI